MCANTRRLRTSLLVAFGIAQVGIDIACGHSAFEGLSFCLFTRTNAAPHQDLVVVRERLRTVPL